MVMLQQTTEPLAASQDSAKPQAAFRCSAHTTKSRGSAISPLRALAATVSGLAKNTLASLCPIRPGKLRLVVLMHASGVFSRPNVSDGPPRHAAQDGSPIFAPAVRNTSSSV